MCVLLFLPAVIEHVCRNTRAKFLATIPSAFDPSFRNPCWWSGSGNSGNSGSGGGSGNSGNSGRRRELHCIPYAFILGQPKCGTTDLYARLTRHPLVAAASAKEVRFFSQTKALRQTRWLTKTGHQTIYKYAPTSTTAARCCCCSK
jgi:hypothetical protein